MSASVGLSPKTCAQKRPYRTKREAKAAIVSVLTNSGGRAMNAFRCEHCRAWHIGHRPPPRRPSSGGDQAQS